MACDSPDLLTPMDCDDKDSPPRRTMSRIPAVHSPSRRPSRQRRIAARGRSNWRARDRGPYPFRAMRASGSSNPAAIGLSTMVRVTFSAPVRSASGGPGPDVRRPAAGQTGSRPGIPGPRVRGAHQPGSRTQGIKRPATRCTSPWRRCPCFRESDVSSMDGFGQALCRRGGPTRRIDRMPGLSVGSAARSRSTSIAGPRSWASSSPGAPGVPAPSMAAGSWRTRRAPRAITRGGAPRPRIVRTARSRHGREGPAGP